MKKYRSIIEVKISNAKSNYKEVSNIGKWNDIHSEHFVAKLIIKKTTNPTVEKKVIHIISLPIFQLGLKFQSLLSCIVSKITGKKEQSETERLKNLKA